MFYMKKACVKAFKASEDTECLERISLLSDALTSLWILVLQQIDCTEY